MPRFSILLLFTLPSLFLLSCGSLSYSPDTGNKVQKSQVSTPAPPLEKERVTSGSTVDSIQKTELKSREKPLENELILPDLVQDAGELITL